MPYILKQLGTFNPKMRKEGEKVIPTIVEWEASKYIAPKKKERVIRNIRK